VGTPYTLSLLTTLCAKETIQPQVNRLVATLYTDLATQVLNFEFPRQQVTVPTRMIEHTPLGIYQGEMIDHEVRAISVNIARAGTLPSQVTFDLLNTVLTPRLVRQDHIVMSRMLGAAEKVVGSTISGSKIGGDVDDAIVLFSRSDGRHRRVAVDGDRAVQEEGAGEDAEGRLHSPHRHAGVPAADNDRSPGTRRSTRCGSIAACRRPRSSARSRGSSGRRSGGWTIASTSCREAEGWAKS